MSSLATPSAELEGDLSAWRNLLWDSVRMLHAGRPDLARRFRDAANDIERNLQAARQMQRRAVAAT